VFADAGGLKAWSDLILGNDPLGRKPVFRTRKLISSRSSSNCQEADFGNLDKLRLADLGSGLMSTISRHPSCLLRRLTADRSAIRVAAMFRVYPACRIAWLTDFRFSGETFDLPFNTRETVAVGRGRHTSPKYYGVFRYLSRKRAAVSVSSVYS
jgi:hypothetical protein